MGDIRALGAGATFAEVSKSDLENFVVTVPDLGEQRRIAARLTAQLAAVQRLSDPVASERAIVDRLRARAYEDAFEGSVPLAVGRTSNGAPLGWSWSLLTDLGRLESGHTPSRNRPEWWGGDVGWIQLADIRAVDGQVINQTLETTNAQGIANSAARILPAGTVVMSRTASVGFVALMGRAMATSQDFVNWVCGPKLDAEFLMHLLIRSREYVRTLSSGAIHKTVYYPTVKAFTVCVPSVEEQRRIVSRLASELAAVDRARAAVESSAGALNALTSAVIREAFSRVAKERLTGGEAR
jgi:type I restriction enzyme S subunit